MAKYTKEQAIAIIVKCAETYRDELLNKTLLFVCIDKHKKVTCYEFSFYSWNFMHLTGVKTKSNIPENGNKISAQNFYSKCLAHKLSPDDFDFSDDGTTHMKLDVLPSVLCKNLAANMIGNYNSAKPFLRTDKIAGGVKACMGFSTDKNKGEYVPNTVLKDDIRNNVSNYLRVIAVHRKNTTDQIYNECTYKGKKIDWDKIEYPDKFSYLQKQ